MPSLKEIKGRIGSVQSTLKITSAMKLVASAKLRKAQQTIEGMRPYERKLQGMLEHLVASGAQVSGEYTRTALKEDEEGNPIRQRVALVAFASNSSLCGAFNANAVRLALETLRSYGDADVTVYSVGRKMADAMRKVNKPSPENYTKLADKPTYAPAAELAEKLMEDFREGRLDRIDLVYNHFVSSGKQVPVRETLLPMGEMAGQAGHDENGTASVIPGSSSVIPGSTGDLDYILEPSASALLADLLPKSLRLKFYTALLDSNASEHAARTVAMQTATDNGEDLLQELTLQYNKSRQQKITSEILDLAGGSQEQEGLRESVPLSESLFDGTHDPDEVAGKAFCLVTAQNGRKGDAVLPHPGGPVHGGGQAELEYAVRVVLQDVAPGGERLDEAVLVVRRIADDIDLPLLVAEERIGEGHRGEGGQDPPDGLPAVLESDIHIPGHHSQCHQDDKDNGEDQRNLNEILEGATEVGHFWSLFLRARTRKRARA